MKEQEIRYELSYTDSNNERQVQSFIPTKDEAFRRRDIYYNSKKCRAVIKEVVTTYENDECVDIEKTIIHSK